MVELLWSLFKLGNDKHKVLRYCVGVSVCFTSMISPWMPGVDKLERQMQLKLASESCKDSKTGHRRLLKFRYPTKASLANQSQKHWSTSSSGLCALRFSKQSKGGGGMLATFKILLAHTSFLNITYCSFIVYFPTRNLPFGTVRILLIPFFDTIMLMQMLEHIWISRSYLSSIVSSWCLYGYIESVKLLKPQCPMMSCPATFL